MSGPPTTQKAQETDKAKQKEVKDRVKAKIQAQESRYSPERPRMFHGEEDQKHSSTYIRKPQHNGVKKSSSKWEKSRRFGGGKNESPNRIHKDDRRDRTMVRAQREGQQQERIKGQKR